MKIGKVNIKGPLVLAPMADVTDLPFRILCKRQGADLVYTEMVNLNALARNNKSTEKRILITKEERPIAIQLFGTRTDPLRESIELIEDLTDIIDFNLGCPAQQIVGSGAGAALLKRPKKVGELVSALVKYSSKPITVKMRLGYEKNNAVKLAKIIEENGADAIAIHGRTYKQGYSGKANWDAIKEVKDSVNIPVIGNGDIRTPEEAKQRLELCDAIMIGRGAMGDPTLFRRIKTYLKNGKLEPLPDVNEKIDLFLEYHEIAKKYDIVRLHILRHRAQDITKSLRGATGYRREISNFKTPEELVKYMKSLKD